MMGISVLIYFGAFPILYSGVCNNNTGMMAAGMIIVAIGMAIDLIFS